MSDLEYLCFILTCREKANKARLKAYGKYARARNKILYSERFSCHSIKKSRNKGLLEDMLAYEKEYRKIADFMSEQKPILRAARKAANYNTRYTTSNYIKYIYSLNSTTEIRETYHSDRIKEIAAGYAFDKIVLIDGKTPINPYELK